MKDVKRQAIGIDVAKLDFAVCFSVCNENRENKHLSTRKFQNNPTGFKDFALWVTKWFNKDLPLSIFQRKSTGETLPNINTSEQG